MEILAMAIGAFVGWLYGHDGLEWIVIGFFATGAAFIVFKILGYVADIVAGISIRTGGLGTQPLVRRGIGMFADLVLYFVRFGLPALYFWSLSKGDAGYLGQAARWADRHGWGKSNVGPILFFLVPMALFLILICVPNRRLRFWIGRGTGPLRRVMRSLSFGYGGSARFAGMLEEWAHPWRPGQIMLGHSLYRPGDMIGVDDDRHLVTIASNRSGKGRSAIIPNLLLWPGSALVIDPKGQNAAVTAARRGGGSDRVRNHLGQRVRIVDPFAVLQGMGVDVDIHQFNPLAEIDIAAFDVVEQIGAITDALVVPSEMNSYWDRSAKSLLAGIIAYVLTDPTIPDDARHLGTVRDILSRAVLPLDRMAQTLMCGGMAAEAANTLKTVGPKTAGLIIGSALEHTDWLQSLAMKAALGASDFSLRELKGEEPVTIYLVLPPDMLDEHGRFLRLFVSMGLKAVAKGVKPRHSVLFLLDEFYALGPLKALATSAGQLAGYGVKLWPVMQNLGQPQEHYRQNWETFMANAGTWQAFAINDETTARYLAQKLGQKVSWRQIEEQWVPAGASPLRTSGELGHEAGRSSGNQLIFREGEDPFLLKRANYDRTFPYEAYSADPMEPGSNSAWGRFRSMGKGIFGGGFRTEDHIASSKLWPSLKRIRAKALRDLEKYRQEKEERNQTG